MAVIYNQRNEEKLLPVDNIQELQPDAGMWLVAQFNQQISGQDFLDRWGRLTVMITYDHGNYERLYDETSIRHKLRD
jgi:hypothetical protein